MAAKKKARKQKKIACFKTKTAAKKSQKKMHTKGSNATVRKTANGYCIYSSGKRKVGIIKNTGQRISGTRKKK